MSSRQISISVRGVKPVPWGSNEWAWRNAIAGEARKQHQSKVVLHGGFEVLVVFYLPRSTLKQSDLDNLAKPVLDTLFLSNYSQVEDKTLTGALFKLDDSHVTKLSLEKQLANLAQEEGTEITVLWEE